MSAGGMLDATRLLVLFLVVVISLLLVNRPRTAVTATGVPARGPG